MGHVARFQLGAAQVSHWIAGGAENRRQIQGTERGSVPVEPLLSVRVSVRVPTDEEGVLHKPEMSVTV